MVALSLRHRVTPGRQASLLSDVSNETPRQALLGLAAATAVLNALFIVAGAVVTGIIDRSWYDKDGSGKWHKDEQVKANTAGVFFLYITIPSALAALSVYETTRRSRRTDLFPTLAIISATAGFVLWLVQLTLQGSCAFDIPGGSLIGTEGFCPYAVSHELDAASFWKSGLAVAYTLACSAVFIIALYLAQLILGIVLLIRQRKATGTATVEKQAYSYHSPLEDTEQHTDRDMPDRSVAPTPVPDAKRSRQFSIRSESMFHEAFPAMREKEMV